VKAARKTSIETVKDTLKSIFIPSYPFKGYIKPVTHNIQRILNIFDPMIHPIAISVCFLNAATRLAASSGREVHIATMVTHIKDIGSQNPSAIATAESTISFPHHRSHKSHRIIKSIDLVFHISFIQIASVFSFFISSLLFGCLAMVKV
jgi:hypothetical protein